MALTKITTGLVAANTLATANIADNSVDATKIASNSILTRHIDDDQVTGDQLADNITIAGNLTITGDLTTNGSTVTNSSSNTTIEDAIIELGTGTSGAPATDAGIVIERGSSDNVFIGWDESADKVTVGTGSFTGASTGNLTITAAPFVSGALTASGISYPTSDGSAGQYLKTDGSGALSFGAVTTQVDNYTATGNGSTTAFDTGINPHNEVNTWIFIDGVYQQKSQYSYSGSTVTFSTAPENGALIDVVTGTTGGMASSDTVLGIYEATTTDTAAYTTGISASNENNTWVFVGGVYQPKDSYTFSSGTLTFDANTPTGQKLSVVATKALTAGSVETTSLGANAVTSVKIASNAILSRHIANNSIVGADISATTGITASTFTGALTGNVTGNVAGNLTGTILTAAQTNITSVGTLSAATVSGQLTAGGLAYPTSDGSSDQVLKTDGSGTISFGTVSGTTLNNNTNNYVMTGTGSANTLNGEANLTFDGSTLSINGSALNFKTFGTSSIMIGDDATGTINAANYNTGLGVDVFAALTEGDGNVALGFQNLDALTTGNYNVAIGYDALSTISTGSACIAIGKEALKVNTSSNNTAVGRVALTANTTGQYNTAIGDGSLKSNTTAANNTAVGHEALSANTTGTSNTAVGAYAGAAITTGQGNSILGYLAADATTTGGDNTAMGYKALTTNTTGSYNVAIGKDALENATTASNNTAVGFKSLEANTTGGNNTCLGGSAGQSNTTGLDNVYVGYNAGQYSIPMITGYNNTVVGAYSRPSANNGNDQIVLGRNQVGAGNSSFRVGASTNVATLILNGGSVSFSVSSDERLKENITDSSVGLNFINDLRPVTYKWKAEKDVPTDMSYYKEGSDKPCKGFGKTNYGFIAQEVKSTIDSYNLADGQNIHRVDTDGTQELAPAELVPMLVKAIQEQQTIIDDLKSRIETLEE